MHNSFPVEIFGNVDLLIAIYCDLQIIFTEKNFF